MTHLHDLKVLDAPGSEVLLEACVGCHLGNDCRELWARCERGVGVRLVAEWLFLVLRDSVFCLRIFERLRKRIVDQHVGEGWRRPDSKAAGAHLALNPLRPPEHGSLTVACACT